MSRDLVAPLDTVLMDCWDATVHILLLGDEPTTGPYAIGRFLSAYADFPGWGIATDIATYAECNMAAGDQLFGLSDNLRRAAFLEAAEFGDAPSAVYLKAMAVELDERDEPTEKAIEFAKKSIAKPEHPWIEFHLGDQLLFATMGYDMDDKLHAAGMSTVALRFFGDKTVPSLIRPIYSLREDAPDPRAERERNLGRSLHAVWNLVSNEVLAALPFESGLDFAQVAFARAYLANGTQANGWDHVLAVNAAAALASLALLRPEQELFVAATGALRGHLRDAHLTISEIPGFANIEIAAGTTERRRRELESAWPFYVDPVLVANSDDGEIAPGETAEISDEQIPPTEQVAEFMDSSSLYRSAVPSAGDQGRIASMESPIADDLEEARDLRATVGEKPRDWESASKDEEGVRQALQAQSWWDSCPVRAQREIEDAMLLKMWRRRSALWARSLGIALEEVARWWIEPLLQLARSRRQITISLTARKADNVAELRDYFTLGAMGKMLGSWLNGRADEIVSDFLSSHLSQTTGQELLQLISRANNLRNRAAHSGSFDEIDAQELEEVTFRLLPALLGCRD